MSSSITAARPPDLLGAPLEGAPEAYCPWCDAPVEGHPPAVLQKLHGYQLVICAYAPVANAIAPIYAG